MAKEQEARLEQAEEIRRPVILHSEHGRVYDMGRMKAVFKADGEETAGRYSISEWWLDPQTRGPGPHVHSDDHIFYVIEGTLSLMIDGRWSDLAAGGYALIPGGTQHDFANRAEVRSGFISLNTPGGFEEKMAGIAPALAAEDLRL
ncbi:cupin domain-containing protein [Caulobacter sp. S45]|uniref:cupin domain-containing protein n=1 Tax=Caulobacter sp. S45 TaxID=1641861 RepID=UPI001C20875E|nr:cupin domain-containing protein [Caulobacter sp. S45]